MAAPHRRSSRDRRRRSHGQNLLVDHTVVERLLARLDLHADELVVDVGAGRGALTIPLARAGARVLAIERDRHMAAELQHRIEDAGVAGRVRIRRADLLLQWEVARKRAASPPSTLRSAAWAPWWRFELGERVPKVAFRPIPVTDSGWLVVTRRDPAVLPDHLAPHFRQALEPHWHPHRRNG